MSVARLRAWEMSLGQISPALSAFLNEMGEDGLRIMYRIKNDPDFRRRVINFMRDGGYLPTASQLKALEIMGENSLSVEKVSQLMGVTFNEEQLSKLREVNISEDLLRKAGKAAFFCRAIPSLSRNFIEGSRSISPTWVITGI